MARLTSRLRDGPWLAVELAVLAGLSAVSVAIQAGEGSGHPDLYTWLFFSPLGRAWWFALGMGLAAISVRAQQRGADPRPLRWVSRHPGVPWAAAVAIYLVTALFVLEPAPTLAGPVVERTEYVFEYVLVGLIAVLVILPAAFGDNRSGVPRRILGHPGIAWLGLISYGIFLWHYPILLELKSHGVDGWWPSMAFPVLAACTLAITVVCAALSYYLLERPLMRLK